MAYVRKNLRTKLLCLERILKEGATLTTGGLADRAFVTLRGQALLQEEI